MSVEAYLQGRSVWMWSSRLLAMEYRLPLQQHSQQDQHSGLQQAQVLPLSHWLSWCNPVLAHTVQQRRYCLCRAPFFQGCLRLAQLARSVREQRLAGTLPAAASMPVSQPLLDSEGSIGRGVIPEPSVVAEQIEDQPKQLLQPEWMQGC